MISSTPVVEVMEGGGLRGSGTENLGQRATAMCARSSTGQLDVHEEVKVDFERDDFEAESKMRKMTSREGGVTTGSHRRLGRRRE